MHVFLFFHPGSVFSPLVDFLDLFHPILPYFWFTLCISSLLFPHVLRPNFLHIALLQSGPHQIHTLLSGVLIEWATIKDIKRDVLCNYFEYFSIFFLKGELSLQKKYESPSHPVSWFFILVIIKCGLMDVHLWD